MHYSSFLEMVYHMEENNAVNIFFYNMVHCLICSNVNINI